MLSGGGAGQSSDRHDLIAAIQRQLSPYWRAKRQAERSRDEVVNVDVRLNRDGSVRQARVEDKQALTQLQAMAEQAHAAILDCGPFELPGDRYAEWQVFTLRFHPRGLY